jgi:intein/homing endonuclease
LANGLSIPIEQLKYNRVPVLTYDSNQEGIIESQQTAWVARGMQHCVQLTFNDGRTLVCTADHRIRTTTGDVKAADLKLKECQVICGGDQPVFSTPTAAELKLESKWSLTAGEMKFTAATPAERAHSMIFCRMVGLALADGSISTKEVVAYLGHELDVKSFINDIKVLVPGHVTQSFNGNVWKITLPRLLTNAIASLPGIVLGGRINQGHKLPDFVATLPKSLLREFLGGLFGGDGHTKLCGVGFSASTTVDTQERLNVMMTEIKDYLGRFGVDATLSNPSENGNKKVQIKVLISNLSIITFAENIGFRYCVHKAARLAAGVTWRRLQLTNQSHNDKLIAKVTELSGYEEYAKKDGVALKMPMTKAYDRAKTKLARDISFVPSFITVKKREISAKVKAAWEAKQDGTPKQFHCQTKINPVEWFKQIGAYQLFNNDDDDDSDGDDDNDNGEHKGAAKEVEENYIDMIDVPRERCVLPTWTLTVVDRRPAGQKQVYDITVPEHELFVANGIVVHNCADIPAHWKSMFRNAGVKKKDLQNPETAKVIYETLQAELGGSGGLPPDMMGGGHNDLAASGIPMAPSSHTSAPPASAAVSHRPAPALPSRGAAPAHQSAPTSNVPAAPEFTSSIPDAPAPPDAPPFDAPPFEAPPFEVMNETSSIIVCVDVLVSYQTSLLF